MTSTPSIPAPDDKDWTWVLERPCPECGFDASAVAVSDVPARIRAAIDAVRHALEAPDSAQRPTPDVWSPLEYACHVRDVCGVFSARLALMRTSTDPQFANWDQDATALAEQYWAQLPAQVAVELARAGERIALECESVTHDELSRSGRRSNGSIFTVDTLVRYLLHDLEHHVHDVVR